MAKAGASSRGRAARVARRGNEPRTSRPRPSRRVAYSLREQLSQTAKQMALQGLTPGMSGNVSVRCSTGMLVTPSGLPYAELTAADCVEMQMDGAVAPGQNVPTSEWQLHRDILVARPDVAAIVHTHSQFCTSLSMLRRDIPAVHYMIVLTGTDAIPCAEYATFGSAKLAQNVVAALGVGNACLLANHGMVALGSSLSQALRLAAEVETLAAQYWHAAQLGAPHVLDRDQLREVRERFAAYGQQRSKPR